MPCPCATCWNACAMLNLLIRPPTASWPIAAPGLPGITHQGAAAAADIGGTHLSGRTLRKSWATAKGVMLERAQHRQPPASCLMCTPPLPSAGCPSGPVPAAAVSAAARLPSSSAASSPAAPNSFTRTAHTSPSGLVCSRLLMAVVFPEAKAPVRMVVGTGRRSRLLVAGMGSPVEASNRPVDLL